VDLRARQRVSIGKCLAKWSPGFPAAPRRDVTLPEERSLNPTLPSLDRPKPAGPSA
jgi:hypothetical protein